MMLLYETNFETCQSIHLFVAVLLISYYLDGDNDDDVNETRRKSTQTRSCLIATLPTLATWIISTSRFSSLQTLLMRFVVR
mmetsp:Transcript_17171/g.41683  ORF Transcript_17171/g.41683 Transcript_17171/m.41683 type:complete len:81 (-) Transcript_17171:2016-2258(-)